MKMLLPVKSLPIRAVSSRTTTTTTDYEPDQSQVTTVRESKLACEAPKTALSERKTDTRLLVMSDSSRADEVVRGRESAPEAETGAEYTPDTYALHSPPLKPPRSAMPERANPVSVIDHSETDSPAFEQLKNAVADAPSAAPMATSPLSDAYTFTENASADFRDLSLIPGCAIADDHSPAFKADLPFLPGIDDPFGQSDRWRPR